MSTAASHQWSDQPEIKLGAKEFAYISALVYDRCGIVLGDHKRDMVCTRLTRRLRTLGLPSFKAYCDLVQGPDGEREIGDLINSITTNLTKFFRESHHFDHLRDVVLREVRAASTRTGRPRLRIWSAGCSSGEEPYSIAMTVLEAVPEVARWDSRILATDIDTTILARAVAGIYPSGDLGELPKALQARYLIQHESASDRVQIADAPRHLITFKQLNLMGKWPLKGPFDAIFCRNVMIYFDAPSKAALVERFAGLLKPGGWLFIGHSESLLTQQSAFKLKGRTIYQKSST